MTELIEIQSCDELIQMLNEKEQFLHAAHVPESSVNFEEKVLDLKKFRVNILQKTEAFLQLWVPDLPAMHGICSQIDQEIEYALSICLSRSNRNDNKKHTEEDAYKFRFLLDYIAFLQDYNALSNRYLEYALGYAGVNPDILKDGVKIGNKVQNLQVQGIPVNNPKPFSQKVLKTEEDEMKVFRMTILKIANDFETGLLGFLETLTKKGWAQFFAALIGTHFRAVMGNVNGEDDIRYTWYYHKKDAQKVVNTFERKKKYRLKKS